MTAKKRLNVRDSRVGTTPDIIDELIDCHAGTAASRVARMSRRQLELCLLHCVRSVDERWRFRDKPQPLPAGTAEQEKMRRDIAAILTKNPEAITPYLLALSDATAAHDPRRADAA